MTNTKQIRKWFSGASLNNLDGALYLLQESEKQGSWVKGASRRVVAALGNANLAQKVGREVRHCFHYNENRDLNDAHHTIEMGLCYGGKYLEGVGAACAKLNTTSLDFGQRNIVDQAERMAADFAPVIALVKLLDRSRPARKVIFATLSPTVVKTFSDLGLSNINLASIREPEIKWEWVEGVNADGRTIRYMVGTILWPEGTKHHCSKFSAGSKTGNRQCQACGHAIKNPYNWVPVLVDDIAGTPYSLWIGRDCAKNLFGATVEGDAQYKNTEGR